MKRLNAKSIWLFFVRSCLTGVVTFGIFFAALWKVILGKGLLPYFILALFVYFCIGYIWARFAYKNWKYEFVEKGVKIEKGVITKSYVTVPYKRIQNVDIHRGIMDRWLGLSTLHIQTAGESAAEGRLPGLEVATAEEVRERLTERAKDQKQEL